eukprot:TRINITY_DN10476_c0_g1_i2.p1 TRINITY_DN10476_c0_g1~~TRINITY_DN10476_c0_g1_i2.p1  ORF type:complete len:317 (-),score=49.15 TRINITY_DN10476_c0_g1_i2:491-1381(-)
MGMACKSDTLSWFGQIVEKLGTDKFTFRSREVADAQWQSFDLADAMEQGQAQELISSLLSARPAKASARQLIMEDSKDGSQHVLSDEDGTPLIFARTQRKSKDMDIYIATGGDPPTALGPAFTLASADADEKLWILSTDRCQSCMYLPRARRCCEGGAKRELARIAHSREKIGRGTSMCMKVDLPELRQDGTPACCPVTDGPELGCDKLLLESKRPKWSSRLGSLTMDFYGRATKASPQNFQLQRAIDQAELRDVVSGEPVLLFGKTEENVFVLDYKNPLGMVQAFAIALTTKVWE